MRITVDTVPHPAQRYDTVGDYMGSATGDLHVSVSDMGNPDYEFLVAIHELVEAYLCRKRGISDEAITDFDVIFESRRPAWDKTSEPGDDPAAPYQNEHNFATAVERMVCAALDVKWADYEAACRKVSA